jgi:acyl-CoA synthetase (AMP-forming)/AMP-acid ligase II
VLVPLNHRLAPRELAEILADSESVVLLIDPRFLPMLEAIRRQLPVCGRLWYWPTRPPEAPSLMRRRSARRQARSRRSYAVRRISCISLYTSGTTGQPKGVMLSERSIIFAVETCQRNVHFTAADRYLHSVSLGHRPAIGFLFATLLGGGCVCLTDFEANRCLNRLQDERITATALVPTMINLLLNAPDNGSYELSAWRLLIYAASPTPEELIHQVARTFGVSQLQAYGMTELTTVTMLLPQDHVLDGAARAVRRLKSPEVSGPPGAGCERSCDRRLRSRHRMWRRHRRDHRARAVHDAGLLEAA